VSASRLMRPACRVCLAGTGNAGAAAYVEPVQPQAIPLAQPTRLRSARTPTRGHADRPARRPYDAILLDVARRVLAESAH
jgi:hypothetical protein